MAKSKKRIPLVRFDWAMKKMLRQKANHDILEGFLSELLKEDIKITKILESEGNQEHETDKYNRVDIFVENTKGELVIIEVQNTQEYDYFHRILYGASKAITENIGEGEKYAQVKKIISITIAYFDLGQGEDYVYHGTTNFVGIHKKDTLVLSSRQRELYHTNSPAKLYPEYWLLKISNFKNKINDTLDEWLFFLKNGEVIEDFKAKGLPEAKEKLDEMKLSEAERRAYNHYKRRMHDRASEEYNKELEVRFALEDAEKQGKEKGREEERAKTEVEKAQMIAKAEAEKEQMILKFNALGVSVTNIAIATEKTEEEVQQIIANHANKE